MVEEGRGEEEGLHGELVPGVEDVVDVRCSCAPDVLERGDCEIAVPACCGAES